MNKKIFRKVIKSSEFLIPSIFIFAGVTIYYVYEFLKNYNDKNISNLVSYWLAYIIITLFLLLVVFINAKKQLINREKH